MYIFITYIFHLILIVIFNFLCMYLRMYTYFVFICMCMFVYMYVQYVCLYVCISGLPKEAKGAIAPPSASEKI